MATAGSRWAIVMSRGAGFSDQVPFVNLCSMNAYGMVELDFLYPKYTETRFLL
jgi:hypothetical protein